MFRFLRIAISLAWVGLALTPPTQTAHASPDQPLVPLDIQLPMFVITGTPPDLKLTADIEQPSDKPRPPFLAPPGARTISLGKKVTSSDQSPLDGALELVTDGDKEANAGNFVELHRRLQWIQIDLGAEFQVYAILIWHAFETAQVYRDVVVQVANDPEFVKDVTTVFNNDRDNSSGLGIATDKEYFENHEGRLIDAKGVTARYVRLYSNGSSLNNRSRYTEVEVHGLPAPAALSRR